VRAGLRVCVAAVLATAAIGIAAPRVDAAVQVPDVSVIDLGSTIRDVELVGDSLWATLADQNRIAEVDPTSLAERRRILVGSGPSGIDVLEDGTLAVALYGATGYVEVDPTTEALHPVTLPLLGAPESWDIAALPGNDVLVSSAPGSGGFAYIVRVDRDADWASARVASGRIIRAAPEFGIGPGVVVVGEGFSPNSLYKLDAGDPALPIVDEDNHGDLSGTMELAVTDDGLRIHLGSGQVVRSSDLTPIGTTSDGYPVLDDAADLSYAVTEQTIRAHETTFFSTVAEYDISTCGFEAASGVANAVLVDGGDAMLVASGSRICRVQLDGTWAPVQDSSEPPVAPAPVLPIIQEADAGSTIHDIEAVGDALWTALPATSSVAEIDVGSLAERRRLLVGTGPSGIDALEDGKLAIALNGATGYAELDPVTQVVTQHTLPLLGAPQTWDVAAIPGNDVLVSSNPGSGGLAYIVKVDRDAGRASTKVASGRIIRAGPVFGVGPGTIAVGEGFSPNSLYRLDAADPALPIVAEDDHGDLAGTQLLSVTSDGSRLHLGSGQVVRSSDLTAIGVTSAGRPVVDDSRGLAYSVTNETIRAHETDTFSVTQVYDISACGFPTGWSASAAVSAVQLVDDGTALIAASGSRLCRVELFQFEPPPPPPPPPPPVAAVVSLSPARLLDTRPGYDTVDGEANGSGPTFDQSTWGLVVAGRGGVPLDAESVLLNVTVVDPVGPGFVTLFSCGDTRPLAANIAFRAGDVISNSVLTELDPDGVVCVYTERATDLVIDVTGYVPAGGTPHPVLAARLMDSRPGSSTVDGISAGSGRLGAKATRRLDVAGRGAVPSTADSVFLNVTVVDPFGSGFVTVYPCDEARPLAASITYAEGDVISNATFAALDATGDVCLYTSQGAHVVVDVTGYGLPDEPLRSLVPARLLDSRTGATTIDGAHAATGRRQGRSTYALDVDGRGGVASGAESVLLNVTAVGPSGPGFLIVYPCGEPRPLAANLTYAAGDVIGNGVLAKVAPDGTVCIYTERATHLVVDVTGYVSPD
jgi:hypothetical protein